jgi:glutamine phosphoribosylpyrophosphate amidotransferase
VARPDGKGLSVCGIFAYHGAGQADPELLTAAAVEAARRGPHGHGWVTRQPDGTLAEHRQLGPLNGDLAALREASATVILGHARLATSGAWDDPGCFQPVIIAGHAIAHNGNVYNAGELAPGAPTDTYALAIEYAALRAAGIPPGQALTEALARASQKAWAVVVLDAGGGLYAHRRYHPLFALRGDGGVYVSSRPFHRASKLLPEVQVITLAAGGS